MPSHTIPETIAFTLYSPEHVVDTVGVGGFSVTVGDFDDVSLDEPFIGVGDALGMVAALLRTSCWSV